MNSSVLLLFSLVTSDKSKARRNAPEGHVVFYNRRDRAWNSRFSRTTIIARDKILVHRQTDFHSTFCEILIVWSTSSLAYTGSCDSCGRECQSACGTRGFRTCCLNYLKKRSTPMSAGSEMKLELMMVLPELARQYSSLRSLIPESPDRSQQLLFEQQDADEAKSSETK